MKTIAIAFAALAAAFTFATAQPAAAAPVSTPAVGAEIAASVVGSTGALVQKTHGWHCRPRFGYDPRVGYRRWHRHPRACRRFRPNRCYVRRKFCRAHFGYGRDYRRCVFRGGCRLH